MMWISRRKIETTNLVDIYLFIKLRTNTKKQNSIFFTWVLYLQTKIRFKYYLWRNRMFMYWNSKQTIKKVGFEFELQTTRRHNITWETFARSSTETWWYVNKVGFITVNFNLNLLDFENNKKSLKLCKFGVSLCGKIPTINKPHVLRDILWLQLVSCLQILS